MMQELKVIGMGSVVDISVKDHCIVLKAVDNQESKG